MNLLKSPVFIICCLLFLFHQVMLQVFQFKLPAIDSYIDNLLAMPIILTLLLFERIYLFRWKGYDHLSKTEVLVATIFISLISELVFPIFSKEFRADWWDVLFYLVGALIFYFTINKQLKSH